MKHLNTEFSIGEEEIVSFRTPAIVETKAKIVEYPLPVVIDRPNNMKLHNNQCLFSMQVRFFHLPLTIEVNGNDKAIFRFYLLFDSRHPDNSLFDKKFDSSNFTITQDMAKEILRDMSHDLTRRQYVLDSLRGQSSGTSLAKRTRESRSFRARVKTSSGKEKTDYSEFTKTSAKSFVSQALITGTNDFLFTSKNSINEKEVNFEDVEWNEVLLTLTIRCYSNVPSFMLAATINKRGTQKKDVDKNMDCFGPSSKQAWKEAVLKNEEIKRRVVKSSGSLRIKPTFLNVEERLTRRPSNSKILMNKKIAKEFAVYKAQHFKALEQKPIDIQKHLHKASTMKRLLKEERTNKIEIEEEKRKYLRSTREAREARQKLIPFQIKSISLLKLFVCLDAMKERFEGLLQIKQKEEKLNQCATIIQNYWKIFSNRVLPLFFRQKRHLDTILCTRVLCRISEPKVKSRCGEMVGVYLKHCFSKIKLKTAMYQYALYGKPEGDIAAIIQRRYISYAKNQRENIQKLADLWEKERGALIRVETRDKSVAQLNGLSLILADVDE